CLVSVAGQDGAGVGEQESPVPRLADVPREVLEVANEDALELRQVTVVGGGFSLTRLGEDALRAGERAQRRVRDRLPLAQVRLVPGEFVQRAESAEDHALVVRPGRAAVVRAAGGKPVVDQARRADHGASVQPLPLAQRPVTVLLLPRYPGGEQRR